MSLPAHSINDRSLTETSTTTFDRDGEVTSQTHGTALTRWFADEKPATMAGDVGPGRWKHPTLWDRNVLKANPTPTIPIFLWDDRNDPTNRGGTLYADGDGWTASHTDLPDYDLSIISRAETKALKALLDQKVNFGVAFAEAKETADLVESVLKRVTKTVNTFRGKHHPRLWEQVKVQEGRHRGRVPKAWLEVQYGWRPMMQDVQGALDQLSKDTQARPFHASCIGRASVDTPIKWRKTSNITGDVYIPVTGKISQRCFVRLDYLLSNPYLASLSQLGLLNPAEIVWERLPYSFVVDWFLPIGGWLSSLGAATGWDFLSGSRSFVRKVNESGSGYAVSENPAITVQGGGNFNWSYTSMERRVYLDSPLPHFPGLKNPFSAQHVGNAFALLATAIFR